ncbi:MAG: class I SAM-dependent methyltransferase [Cytophagaceae bacterium]|nr:class I SAM-dependent methyltransferase [Cytophagaceae bacterium]
MKSIILLFLVLACGQTKPKNTTNAPASKAVSDTAYGYRAASRDGIGKIYLGREIAQVMGHFGADWLERPEREREERTDLLLDILALKPTDTVADIGAGTGYFTFRMAPKVPQGKVLAVDIQPEMLGFIRQSMSQRKVTNVQPVLGTIEDPRLPPNSVDVVLLVDAYHEFSHPREMIQRIATALRPGGRVVLVEYRLEDPNVPIKELHKMSLAQAEKEMQIAGLRRIKLSEELPQQHVMEFGR